MMTWLARLPVNYPAVWATLLALPILIDLRGTGRRLARCAALLRRTELRSRAERAAFSLMVFLLLAHWFVALLPEVSADGLAMHLAIPTNIAASHMLTFQPGRFLWAVMPMGADWTYAIGYLLGGEYAAHLLNFAMLLLLEALLYCAVRRWVTRTAAFLILALFAATPLVYLVTGSLFVENFIAAMVFGMMTALWRFGESGEKRFLYLAAMLGGTALAIKFGALAFVGIALPIAAMEVRRHWRSLGPKPLAAPALACAVFLLTALPTYAIAYWRTGNPVFPFLNQKFRSPLLDPAVDIRDLRFRKPLNGRTLYDLTFRTSLFYEGEDGSFGFQYLALAPLSLVAIVFVKRRPAVSATVVALGAMTVIMASEPNTRYLYSALPLLSVPFAALLDWASGRRWLYRVLMALAVACIALNAYFLPSAAYYHKDFGLRLPFSRAERDRSMSQSAPIRPVIAYFNRAHPGAAVLLPNDAAAAGLLGDIYQNHWHQYTIRDQIRHAATLPDMLRLMQRWHVEYFIAHRPYADEPLEPATLEELMERCAALEYQVRGYYLARLDAACHQRNAAALAAPPPAGPPIVATTGFYDDADRAIVFRGDWTRHARFEGPERNTVSYTDSPGAEAAIEFEGTALTYVFTKASNRGKALVTIDGVSHGTIDLYSPAIHWQSKARFCCLSAGRHTAVIRALGTNRPGSTGQFIDLDAFIVE